jgi:hypothetical protein
MATKKGGYLINPATSLHHNGKVYKGGTVAPADLSEEEASALPYGTLIPATDTELRGRMMAENQVRTDNAQKKVDGLTADLEAMKKAEAERVAAFEKESELAQTRLEQAQKALHEAQQEQAKAQSEMDGGKPESAEPPPTPAMAAAIAARDAVAKAEPKGGKK